MHKHLPLTRAASLVALMVFLFTCQQVRAEDDTTRTDDTSQSNEQTLKDDHGSFDQITWLDDYGQGVSQAIEEKRLLLICFNPAAENGVSGLVDEYASDDSGLAEHLDEFVLVRLSVEERFEFKGEDRRLLEYSAFRDMENRPGIAVIDYKNLEAEQYGSVVSVYPLTASRKLDRISLSTLLTLPSGTLTQRTLVMAVSLHKEKPKSVDADWDSTLATEVASHSVHQARINLQGHHNWNSRFHRINNLLGNGMRAQEVCAESWPGQSLVDAAEECVDSWRHSSGHWSAVSGKQRRFAYDMKRGSNGVWYATGIFAR